MGGRGCVLRGGGRGAVGGCGRGGVGAGQKLIENDGGAGTAGLSGGTARARGSGGGIGTSKEGQTGGRETLP